VIVPQTRDEQLEAYFNFGKNIPGTIDIGAQSLKIAGPSDIGQRATVPIPGAGAGQMRPAAAVANLAAPGSADIATKVANELGIPTNRVVPDGTSSGPVPETLMNTVTPTAAAPAQDGNGFFSNLLKGSVFDSENPLTRQQRIMLGVAALKDAGNALEGKGTNFFGKTQQGIQQARESTAERQFKFLQQARIAGSEAATLLGSITTLTPPSQRAQIERQVAALKQMQENFLQQAGVGQQPAPATQGATPSVGGMSEEDATLEQSQRRAISLASGRIMGTVEQTGKDLEFLSKAALEDPERFLPLLESAQKTVNEFDAAKAGASAEVANTNNQIRNIVEVLLPNVESGAGLMSLLNVIPGTEAADFEANLDSLKAFEGFSNLQRMREISPTGGALGQVTERELMFLQSAFVALKATTSGPALKKNLGILLESYKTVVRKAYQGADGGYNKGAETVFGPPPDWLSEEQLDETSPVVDENTYLGGDSVLRVEGE
jgi:hypothetical protein